MKKLYIFAVLLAVAGCGKMQDDLFSESSSARVQNLMDAAMTTLTSSEQGWFFEYYPGWDANMEMGGYWYWCKFDADRTVSAAIELDLTAGGQNYPAGELVISSPFDIVRGRGAVLSFNIKNELLDFFTEPSSSAPTGQQGDTDFSIVDVQPNIVTVKGIKTNKLMYFYRKTDTKTVPEAFKDVAAADKSLYFLTIEAQVAGATDAIVSRTERQLTLSYTADGTRQTFSMPSVPMLDGKGLHLSKPVKVMGAEISSFIYNSDSGALVSDDAAGTVVLGLPSALNELVIRTVGELRREDASMCAEFVAGWDFGQKTVKTIEGEDIQRGYFGAGAITTAQAQVGTPSLNFRVGAPGGTVWGVYFLMSVDPVAGTQDQVAISYTAQGLNGNYSSYTTGLEPMAKLVARKSPYTLTIDNPKGPTFVKYTSQADPTFFFTTYL